MPAHHHPFFLHPFWLCSQLLSRRKLSFDSWVQAFHVFAGVYTSRFPSDGPGLMKYGSTIQDLAARGLSWRFYDENFRFLRQTPATSFPWGPFIGSFGSAHKARSVRRSRKPLQTLESLCRIFVFQGVFVFLTIGVVTVWAVPLSMIVLNVRAPTVL